MDNSNGFMVRERLYTPEGGFVTEVQMPPFMTKPEVLIWGARAFIHVDSFLELAGDAPVDLINIEHSSAGLDEGCYVEAFAYYVPPRVEDLPRRDLLEMIGSTAADMPGVMTALGDPIPKPTEIAPDHYETKSKWSTIKDQEPMPDRVYVHETIGIPCPVCTEFSNAPGYHWNECPVAMAAKLSGTARDVYIQNVEHELQRNLSPELRQVIRDTPEPGHPTGETASGLSTPANPAALKGYCGECGTPGGGHRLACSLRELGKVRPGYCAECGYGKDHAKHCSQWVACPEGFGGSDY